MARIDLSENQYMEKFVSQDHIDSNDVQFWYQLLSCSFNFMRVQDPKIVDKTLDPYMVRLTLNNSDSLNIGSLARVIQDRVSRIKPQGSQSTSPYFVYQSFNALYLMRCICKSYIENLSEDKLIESFRARVDSQTSGPPGMATAEIETAEVTPGPVIFEQILSTLVAIIVDIPQNDSTYLLQVEAINALLVLLSIQMYTTTPASQLKIYRSLMLKKCSIHALVLTKTLLTNFMKQQPLPEEPGSIIIGLASGLWKVLTLGYGAQDDKEEDNIPLLAKQSLLLLNTLINHHTAEKNPYREAIVSCQDSKFNPVDSQLEHANNDALITAMTSKSALISNSIKIEFGKLFDTICQHLSNDQVALLLYILIHSNQMFKPYILTTRSANLDNLVLPLLKILYTSIEKGSHHIYMVVIIFIILSEEVLFNEAIHKTLVRGVPWYKDRILSDISLGSITTLIIARSFQFNSFRIKDRFLHSNLYATLANLSNYFYKLHPYVCQRLIEILERLSKRYHILTKPAQAKQLPPMNPTLKVLSSPDNPLAKALATDTQKQNLHDVSSIELDSTSYPPEGQQERNSDAINISIPNHQQQPSNTNGNPAISNGAASPQIDSIVQNQASQPSPSSNSSNTDHVNISFDADSRQDVEHLEEAIRMMLSVLNNSLAMQLEHNSDLIYTLLYKRHVFSQLLLGQQSFYNMVINIERILTYFYDKIESSQTPLSVEEIKELIQATSKEWNYKPQDLSSDVRLFHYQEDEQPEEFFIPYIWTRIYYSSGIHWNPKQIVLFNPEDL